MHNCSMAYTNWYRWKNYNNANNIAMEMAGVTCVTDITWPLSGLLK